MVAPEVPDWTRVVLLSGIDPSGDPITIAVDASGYIVAVMKGQYGTELKNIAVDGSGRLIMVPYGTTTVAGTATVTQVAKDREIQGSDGAGLHTIAVDASGQMIMVPRGQSGKYMLVDADGYLTTVLKGIEGTTLHTVAVDASGNIVAAVKGMYGTTPKDVAVDGSGRMIMIPTDPADVWGNAISMGNAELAACLSVAKRFDRRGHVYFIDDFGNGLAHCSTTKDGTGADVSITSAETLAGGQACKITGGSDSGKNAQIAYYLSVKGICKLGLETGFRVSADVDYMVLNIAYYDGTNVHYGRVKFDKTNSRIQYMDSNGDFQDLLTSASLNASPNLFYIAKLVLDPVNNLYTRLLFLTTETNMSSHALRVTLSSEAPSVLMTITVYSTAGKNGYCYVDPVSLTINEPA